MISSTFKRISSSILAAIALQRAFQLASSDKFEESLEVLTSNVLQRLAEMPRSDASIQARMLELYLNGMTKRKIELGTLIRDLKKTTTFTQHEKCFLVRYVLATVSTFRKTESEMVASMVIRIEVDKSKVGGTLLSRFDFETRMLELD